MVPAARHSTPAITHPLRPGPGAPAPSQAGQKWGRRELVLTRAVGQVPGLNARLPMHFLVGWARERLSPGYEWGDRKTVGRPRSRGSNGQCREHVTLVGRRSPVPLAGPAKPGTGCQPGVLELPPSRNYPPGRQGPRARGSGPSGYRSPRAPHIRRESPPQTCPSLSHGRRVGNSVESPTNERLV